MANWYKKYYNEGKRYPAGKQISGIVANGTPSPKQMRFYKNLVEFLTEKGQSLENFEKPRNKFDMSKKISGMKTICDKNGWKDEFYSRYYKKGEQTDD